MASDLTLPAAPGVWVDPRLKVEFIAVGPALTIYDVFFTMLSAMRRLAPLGPSSRLGGSVIECAFDMRITYTHSGPSPSVPPCFENQWLIKALPRISEYMLGRGEFTSIAAMLHVDMVEVGGVKIQRSWGGELAGPAFNGTVS